MSESAPYKDGEVVWVKWGSVWWPGEVWSNSRVPEDIITSLRKPVIAFVKFFQEDSFEFVRSPNNICQYNSEKKMDFIKKGMDKYRSNNKIMTNFPADVVKAEQLTNGNVNILSTLETPTKSKGASSSSNVTSSESAKKSTQSTVTTTPSPVVVSKKSVGSYNSSVKVQNTTSSVQKSNDKKLTCTMCNFATDRMNLLMMHIKNHSLTILSRVNTPSSLEARKSIVSNVSSRKLELDDGIAEDVRKIKESMKETPVTSTKKSRTPASATSTKSTPKLKQSRQTRKEKKSEKETEDEKISIVTKQDVEMEDEQNKPKQTNTCELKKELLADWLDEEDVKLEDNNKTENVDTEIIKSPAVVEKPIVESPVKSPEKSGEVSRSIRNIPKKQRVSEMYIQPEPEKVELSNSVKIDESPPPDLNDSKQEENEQVLNIISTPEITKKTQQQQQQQQQQQKASKRKHATSDSSNEPEKKKMSEESDEKILMATAELLNETEVPKMSNVQSPSTFHTNDIDKRYLPPKERNKRIFRAKNSPETAPITSNLTPSIVVPAQTIAEKEKISTENESKIQQQPQEEVKNDITIVSGISNNEDIQLPTVVNNKNDRQELMLPHKKKQSSRLLTAENVSPVREIQNITIVDKGDQNVNAKSNNNNNSKKIRKSNDSQNSIEMEKSIKVAANVDNIDDNKKLSPLREVDRIDESIKCSSSPISCDTTTITTVTLESINRGQKRQHSKDSQPEDSTNELQQPESKKPHKSETPRTIKACSSETICITSKGTLAVARRDSIKTTQANSVVVTSQLIISEATKPIVSTQSSIDSITSPKQSISTSVTLFSQQSLKNALKIPKENMEEMKKQGLLTIENNRTKLTPKGRQKFKEFQSELNSTVTSSSSSTSISVTSSSSSLSLNNEINIDENVSKDFDVSNDEKPTNSESPIKLDDAQNEKSAIESSSVVEEEPQKLKSIIIKENNNINKSEEIQDECVNKEEVVAEKSNDVQDVQQQEQQKESEETQNNNNNNNNKNNINNNNEIDNDNVSSNTSNTNSSNNNINDNDNDSQDEKKETKKMSSSENDTDSQRADICNDVTITADEKFESTKEAESDNKKIELAVVEKEESNSQSVSLTEDESEETEIVEQKPVENGENVVEVKEIESNNSNSEEIEKDNESDTIEINESADDPNSGSTGLIALQAETFGGPPNCFYLCRQIEDRYEPVDNQILVLNAQNALVPYEGIISDLGLASAETVQENLSAYSQLSPNSNIIINTPNGQKIELSHLTILALQDQADEHGNASVDLAGEQLELNINAILEAIASQQDVSDTSDSLIPGAVLLESADGPLIIENDLPLDVHHPSVATQVSETLSKPIMSTTVAPEIAINTAKQTISENVSRTLNIEDSLASIGVTTQRANVPKSLELPITVTNPTIAETVNHRKLAASLGTDIVTETFVVQQSTDNGSDD